MSRPRDIRLLLSDVDGTLVPHDKTLTPEAVEAVAALRAAGIGFTVTSSRPPYGVKMLIEPLKLDLPIGGCNGALTVDPDLNVLATNFVDPVVAPKVVAFLQDAGVDVWLYTDTDWFVPSAKAAHVEREAWVIQSTPRVADSFTADQLARAVKIVGVSDDHARLADAEAKAQDRFGETVSATRSSAFYLDVTNPKANKGEVVDALARRLGIEPRQIATIGDGANDVLMFRRGGYSIAMGNADDAVKAEADETTLSNGENGFAHAVRHFILQESAA